MKFNNKKLRESVEEWLVDEKLAELKYGHISEWDVSNVTNMSNLFSGCSEFNEDLSKWETIKVKNFSGMFQRAKLFNQDINY
jgi:surface protein